MKDLTTYLTFDGNCREAMRFYAGVLEGKLDLMTVATRTPRAPRRSAFCMRTSPFPADG